MPAGAEVHVDGRPPWRAPPRSRGSSRAAFRPADASRPLPRELSADVVASQTTDLGSIKLERSIGALLVRVRLPTSSSVSGLRHLRPSLLRFVAVARRRSSTICRRRVCGAFTRVGWPDRSERVTIEAAGTARVATTFQGGTVTINSSPAGATVLQGGLLLGKTPLTLENLPPQDVTYELNAHGYEPLKVSGTLAEGRALELNGTLLDLDGW